MIELDAPAPAFRLEGRILFLSESAELVQAQLARRNLTLEEPGPLRSNVSTDEITPAWICYYFDEKLGDYPYIGLKCQDRFPIGAGSIRKGGFEVTVSVDGPVAL